ncbi:hypothetical protein [Actinoplanes sp. NPDC051494]|uniref:hypothetical protein n=1 Tax=Actinoplanes sp. NPDC051494 TaxID=3363907 RepID=UPI0037B3DCAA
MTVDLIGTVRLLHRVFAFLAEQSDDQLADLAAGRATLTAAPAAPERPTVVPAQARPPATTDYAGIAAALRDQESVNDGVAYLESLRVRGKKPTKQDLIAIAAEMGLTLAPATRNPDMIRKLTDHAVGARRKYAGLGSW